ncbi:MAG: cell wall-binding repeat-containing protein [Actinomycetota bacterium]|jgi:putative cell wall-binding protein|nr:cell wall-binding repeat-containing protein [Actinomycetota bacterium]
MRKLGIVVFLATLTFAGVAVAGSVGAAIWGTDGAAVTNDTLDQLSTALSGDRIVWSEYNAGAGTDDVVGYDFSKRTFFDVSVSTTADESHPAISGNVVAWVQTLGPRPYTDVYLKNLATGDELNISNIANLNGRAGTPSISGDFVVWDDLSDKNAPLRVYHIPSGEELVIPTSGGDPDISTAPDIWSDGDEFRIVWARGGSPYSALVLGEGSFDQATGQFSKVATQTVWDMFPDGTPAQDGNMTAPSIWGDVIAWCDWRSYGEASGLNVYAFDMATDTLHDVGVADDHDTDPQVQNGWVSWQHWRGGNPLVMGPKYTDLYLYSTAEKKSVRVTDSDLPKAGLAFDSNRLAWVDLSDPDNEVKSTVLAGPVGRSAGLDRYSTAVMASRLHFTSSNTVVLATGENYPDALSAASLAGAYECPILLTRRDALPASVKREIGRLGATQIVIVGGYGAVSQELEASLGAYSVRRISGRTRYSTSQAIAEEVMGIWGTDGAGIWSDGGGWSGGPGWTTVFIARGDSFADALSVSPVAYATGIPVVLTESDALSPEAIDYITGQGCTEAIILGGTGAVSPAVQSTLDGLLADNGGAASTRWYGSTRYTTAADIADEALLRGWATLSRVGLATGSNFPDALAGGPAVGIGGGVLLMVDPLASSAGGSVAAEFLEARHAGVGRLEVLGGTSVISESVADDLNTTLMDSFEDPPSIEDPLFFEDPTLFEAPVFFDSSAFFEEPAF